MSIFSGHESAIVRIASLTYSQSSFDVLSLKAEGLKASETKSDHNKHNKHRKHVDAYLDDVDELLSIHSGDSLREEGKDRFRGNSTGGHIAKIGGYDDSDMVSSVKNALRVCVVLLKPLSIIC